MEKVIHKTVSGVVAEFTGGGILLRSEADARDLILAAHGDHADWVAIHEANIDTRFFDLKTGLAGDLLQKFVNYNMKLAVLGDISRYTEKSEPLAALVRESNRGKDVRFAAALDELLNGL
ncbi:MAG TPA: DUF4180 domain-containing protein [Rhizomicrobium sp.]|jgi:hypothetical protein|nr:DUF4180 domain-containing protein [Rhizomicrobium sp.]